MKITRKGLVAVSAALALVAASGCKKKDKDDDEDEESTTAGVPSGGGGTQTSTVKPGTVLGLIDEAMGTIAFSGQAAASLRLDGAWATEHCEESGNGTKAAYENEQDVVWGCLLSTTTDGPDTPRGGVNRVKQVTCSVDQALAAGTFAVDDAPHSFKAPIDADCWGAEFAEMAAEQLPDLVNAATGFAEVELTVTGFTTVPAAWTDVASAWQQAYEIVFGFSADEKMTYKLLLTQNNNGVAAAILETENERSNVFSMAITKTGGADDEHAFRYEGRFGFGEFGDGSFGSRHVRVLVAGPYAGGGGFSRIDSGSGYEASMWGTDANTPTNGMVSSFMTNTTGLEARRWDLDANGADGGSPTDYGVDGINTFAYGASAAELASFLTTPVAAFTDAEAWFKANGPLSYDSVVISD